MICSDTSIINVRNNNRDSSEHFLKEWITEFIELLFYLLIAFLLVYFVSPRVNRIIFLLLLPIIWFSKRDYFWIGFFFIMMEYPGGLFSGGLKDDPYRLPIYNLGPGVSFTINELFILLLLLKSFFVKRIVRNYSPPLFRKELKLLFWLYIGLILISPVIGMNTDAMSNVFKLSISLTLFYSIFHLINSQERLIKFLKIIFPFTFVAIAFQIYGLIYGEQLIAMVKPGVNVVQGSYDSDYPGGWIRPIELGNAMLITFSGSLLLLITRQEIFSKRYLILINLISFLVILMSGTRSWFIAFCSGYVLFIFMAGKKIPKLLINSIVVILIVIFSIREFSVVNRQVKNAFSRIMTIEKVIEGDITGGGTISRYNVRAPKVMQGFYSSTIILGAGFSDHFYEYSDGHVGYQNILLNVGIAGFLIFIYVILKILWIPFKITGKVCRDNKTYIRISVLTLIILLIVNTGTQTIGFTPDGINRIILMSLSLILIDLAVKKSMLRTGDSN